MQQTDTCKHCGEPLPPDHKGPCPKCKKTGKHVTVAPLSGVLSWKQGKVTVRLFNYDPRRLAKALILGACLAIANGLIIQFAKTPLWEAVLLGFILGAGVSIYVDNPWKERMQK